MTEVESQPLTDVAAGAATTVDDTNKVFAGNLAFVTTEEQLKEVFAEVGKVTHVQIIHRGTRSLGYGFVTYATEAEAQKAVSTLDKRELAGREINVESAKPQLLAKQGGAEGEDGAKAGGRGARRTRGTRRGAAASRRPRTDEGEEGGAESATQENGGGEKAGGRKPKKAAAATNGSSAAAAPRKPKGPPEGPPSKTLLFVANLPFQFTDEQLQAAFEGFQITSAKVIKRRFGSRTKGFGFVDMASEEEQQRALNEVQGKTVEGRALSLKVAIQGQDRAADANEGEAEAAAEATGAPAA